MKLTYFPVRGRLDPTRLMLEMARVPYEFVAVTDLEMKAKVTEPSPFGQVPILHDGDLELCQSMAIARHVARKLGMMGSTPEEQARVDSVTETAIDVLATLAPFFWDPDFTAKRAAHRDTMANKLEQLERYFTKVRADATHWVLPERFTLADVMHAYTLETLLPLHPGLVEGCPGIHGAMNAVFCTPGVREYVRSDRRPRIWTAPRASFGGKPEETHHFTD